MGGGELVCAEGLLRGLRDPPSLCADFNRLLVRTMLKMHRVMVEFVTGVIAKPTRSHYQQDHDSHVLFPTTEKGLRG